MSLTSTQSVAVLGSNRYLRLEGAGPDGGTLNRDTGTVEKGAEDNGYELIWFLEII